MNNNGRGYWRELFSVRGRNGRLRFWQVTGLYLLALLVLGALGGLLESELPVGAIVLLSVALVVLGIGGFVASFCNHVKRLHDLGLSGWWLLLSPVVMAAVALLRIADDPGVQLFGALVQFVVSVGLLVLFGGIPGQRKPNRFGEPPGGAPLTEPQEQPA